MLNTKLINWHGVIMSQAPAESQADNVEFNGTSGIKLCLVEASSGEPGSVVHALEVRGRRPSMFVQDFRS